MQATITKINRFTQGKDGQPLKTKDGRPYTRVVIQIEEQEKPLSGFENADTKAWKEGSIVDIETEQKGEYFNFRVPKKEDKVLENTETILNNLVGMKISLQRIIELLENKKSTYPTRESEDMSESDPF